MFSEFRQKTNYDWENYDVVRSTNKVKQPLKQELLYKAKLVFMLTLIINSIFDIYEYQFDNSHNCIMTFKN